MCEDLEELESVIKWNVVVERSRTLKIGCFEEISGWCCFYALVVVDVNNFKNGRKPVKLQKESPAGSRIRWGR